MRFSKIWSITAVFTLILSLFFLVLPTTPVAADNTCTWTGGSGDWSDPDNWSNCDDDVPGVDDTAVINSGNPVVDITTSVGNVTVGTSGGLTIDDGVTLTILDTFSQNNTIGGDGDMVIEGHWYWLGGNHGGGGETTLSAGGQMTITLNTGTQLNRTIINNGNALWNAQDITSVSAGGGLFVNNGSFTVTHAATFQRVNFDNQGSFTKTGDSGVVSISVNRFTNDGTVNVETGTLFLQGSTGLTPPVDSGSYTAAPGATLRFGLVNRTLTAASSLSAETVWVSGGTLNIQGSYDVTTTTLSSGTTLFNSGSSVTLPVLLQTGGIIDGDDPLLVTNQMLWSGNALNGPAPLTIAADATLTIEFAGGRQLNRDLVNEGTARWLQGNISSSSGGLGTLINNGELTTSHAANTTANTLNFVNNGRFIKTGSSQLSFGSNPSAQNNGEIHVVEGNLRFNNGLDNYASNTLTGGTFVITGTLQIQNADIHLNQADVTLHTASAALQNTAGTPANALANLTENGTDGRIALRDGAAIALPHSLTNQGELVIGPGSSLAIAGTLTNNGLLRQTIDNVAESTTFLDIGGYGGVTIDPAGNMGPTTVAIRGSQDCTTDPSSQPVQRCFDIKPDTPQTATITFYYAPGEANGNEEDAVNAYRWTGSAWEPAGGTPSHSSGADPRWVEVPDVSSYSPFVLDSQTPTAVSLANISVNTAVSPLAVLLLLLLAAGTVLSAAAVRRSEASS